MSHLTLIQTHFLRLSEFLRSTAVSTHPVYAMMTQYTEKGPYEPPPDEKTAKTKAREVMYHFAKLQIATFCPMFNSDAAMMLAVFTCTERIGFTPVSQPFPTEQIAKDSMHAIQVYSAILSDIVKAHERRILGAKIGMVTGEMMGQLDYDMGAMFSRLEAERKAQEALRPHEDTSAEATPAVVGEPGASQPVGAEESAPAAAGGREQPAGPDGTFPRLASD